MADHNIQINVNISGSERAKQELQNLKSIADSFNNYEISPKIAVAQISQSMQTVKKEIDSLTKQKNELQLTLKGQPDVSRDIAKLESQLSELKTQYDTMKGATGKEDLLGMGALSKEIASVEDKLSKLKEQQLIHEGTKAQLEEVNSLLDGTRETLQEMGNAKTEIINDESLQRAKDEAERLKEELAQAEKERELKIKTDQIDSAISKVEMLASVLNIASSVSSGLGDFGGMFASSFQSMSNMFSFDALSTAKRYLTAMATNAVTGQINGIVERYDIMNTFTDYMEAAGVSDTMAQSALDAVDQSIRGIPIGLDEAAFRLRKYQMYLGDIGLSRDFTIGIQKAITAGGATEQMKNQAYNQIDRLLMTGQLGQSRQWLSLFNGLGVSLRFLKEEMGLEADTDLRTVAKDLANGTIPVENFINAIAKLSSNEGLDRLIEIYKGTIEAWRSNINNAIKRGGQNILQTVNDVMDETYGYGVTGVMKKVRDGIDTVASDSSKYIKENPKIVYTLGDAIGVVLEKASTLDGGRFVENVVNNVRDIADAFARVFDSIPPGFLEDFTSFAVTWAGPLATVMTAAQSGFGVVLGVFERVKDMNMGDVISKITREIQRMADIVFKLLDAIPDGLLGDLMAFGLVWGKPLSRVFSTMANGLGLVSSALKDMKATMVDLAGDGNGLSGGLMGKFMLALQNFGWGNVAGIAGGFALLAGSIMAVIGGMEEMKEKGRDYFNLDEVDQALEHYQNSNDRYKEQVEEYQKDLDTIRSNADDAHALIKEIFDLYAELDGIESEQRVNTILERLAEDISELQALYPGVNLDQLLTGEVDPQNAQNLRDIADAYVDMVTAQAEADASREELTETFKNKRDAEALLRQQRKERQDLLQDISTAERYLDWLNDPGNDTVRTFNRNSDGTLKRDVNGKPTGGVIRLGKVKQYWDDNLSLAEGVDEAKERAKEYDATILETQGQIDEYGDHVEEVREMIRGADAEANEFANTDFSPVTGGAAQLSESVQKIADTFNDAKTAAQDMIDTALAGFGQMEAAGPELDENGNPTQTQEEWLSSVWSGMLEGQQSQNVEAERYQAAIEKIEGWYTGLADAARESLGPMVGEIVASAWDDRELALALADRIEQSDWEGISQLAAEKLKEQKISSKTSDAMARIQAATDEEYDEAASENPDLFNIVNDTLEAMDGLNQIDFSGLVESMKEGAKGAEPMTKSMEEVSGAEDNVSSSANSAKNAISQLANTASNKAGSFSGIVSSIQDVADVASMATGSVRALARAIDSLQSKTITISVNMNAGGVVGAAGGFGAGLSSFGGKFAHGGLISYLADGGFPGIGRGTDTIPAWLTPGEYVMKRSAVGMFGSRFMDRINKMDIGGAFDALMSRISNPMHMGGNTYNRDNHATVNNYFYGDNGQNYSQRKAYRYAGSL